MTESAYQIARRHGYRFSEEQWLKSLKGPNGKGEKGERGERGPRGLSGVDGRNGKDGRDGLDGKAGKDGRDGIDGSLPEPMPWKATFERDTNRLTKSIRIKAADGSAYEGRVSRDATGVIAEVEIVPLLA